MNPLRYVKALSGFGDVDVFWKAQEELLQKPGKHYFDNFLCKIVRKHYGVGILVLSEINRFSMPHGFLRHFRISEGEEWCRC